MPDFEREKYLHKIRAEAWDAFMQRYSSTGDAGQIFAAAAEVYERELRTHLDIDEASDRDYTDELRAVSEARDIAYEMLSQLVSGPEREDVLRIVAKLDEVLGPDLVREADPTGQVLRPLAYEERERLLDAIPDGPLSPEHERAARGILDSVEQLIEAQGGKRPTKIIILEDEVGPILAKAREHKRDATAERLSDYLTQLGVNPDETFEGDTRTTAQILADVALDSGPIEVGGSEHVAVVRLVAALMTRQTESAEPAWGEGRPV